MKTQTANSERLPASAGSPTLSERIRIMEVEIQKLKRLGRVKRERVGGFGGVVQGLREKAEKTLSEVSAQSGLSKGLLSDIEHGKRDNPEWKTLKAIAPALGVTVIELVGALVRSENDQTVPTAGALGASDNTQDQPPQRLAPVPGSASINP